MDKIFIENSDEYLIADRKGNIISFIDMDIVEINKKELGDIIDENKRLKEALNFYTDSEKYHFDSFGKESYLLWKDSGDKARQALKGK